ncbi:MAG: hypothetical protein GY754_13890 [bacterium]|nr:hypothetical protein [bacterium]
MMVKSPIPLKWVKVGQKDSSSVNTYHICNYIKVGQVGQNHLTHFLDFNSLSSGDLIVFDQSGAGIPERDRGKKINMDRTELLNQFLEEEQIKGRREQGLIGLKYRVPKYFIFLDESDLCLTTVGTSGALDYQLWLIETGRKDGGSYSMRTVSSY